MANDSEEDETEHETEAEEATEEEEVEPEAETDEEEEEQEAEAPEHEPTVVRPGRDFEREYELPAAEVGAFLVAVGNRLREGGGLVIDDPDGEWTLPFEFGDPVELEIEFEGVDRPELEIEVELPARTDENAPDVS